MEDEDIERGEVNNRFNGYRLIRRHSARSQYLFRAERLVDQEFIISCGEAGDGFVECNMMSGDRVGMFAVPSMEQPYGAWLAAHVANAMQSAEGRLRLVDPEGNIFCTQRIGDRFVCIREWEGVAEGVPSSILRELSVLRRISHPNIVRLLDVSCSPGQFFSVFELMDRTLRDYLRNARSAGDDVLPETVKGFARQLILGVEHLHENLIMHRDLQPYCLVIDQHLTLKIGDFSIARGFSIPLRSYTHEVVTLWYRAPEILLGSTVYGPQIDMWSCGCILAEMGLKYLFRGDSEIGQLFMVFQQLGTPTVQQWPGLRELPHFKEVFPQWRKRPWPTNLIVRLGGDGVDLLEGLLTYDPMQRLSAKRALRLEYLSVAERADGDDIDDLARRLALVA